MRRLVLALLLSASTAHAEGTGAGWIDDPMEVDTPPAPTPPADTEPVPPKAPTAPPRPVYGSHGDDPDVPGETRARARELPDERDEDEQRRREEKKRDEEPDFVGVQVVLEEQGYKVTLQRRRDENLSECAVGPCFFVLEQGKYRLDVVQNGVSLGHKDLRLRRPEKLTVSPPNPGLANAALVAAIVGSPVFVAGVGLLFVSAFYTMGTTHDSEDNRRAGYGLLMMLGGGALAGVGWPMFFTLHKPSVNHAPLTRNRASNDALGTEQLIVDGKGPITGAGAGWTLAF
jgi:hypothetical protein